MTKSLEESELACWRKKNQACVADEGRQPEASRGQKYG